MVSNEYARYPHAVLIHQLDVDLREKPVKQKKMKFSDDRHIGVREEVKKLLQTTYII